MRHDLDLAAICSVGQDEIHERLNVLSTNSPRIVVEVASEASFSVQVEGLMGA